MNPVLNTTTPRCANSRGHDTEMEVSMPRNHPISNGLLDAVLKVQSACEQTSSPTRTVKVTQTTRPTGATNKGRRFPASPPSDEEASAVLDAMFNTADHAHGKWVTKWGPMRYRNRTIVETIAGSGLRIHEVLLLKPADLNFDANQVVVRRGKGGKRRISAISNSTLAAVNGWMFVWDRLGFSVENDDWLFPVLEGPSRGGPLSQAYLRTKIHEAASAAGVTTRCAPHQWRHRHAVTLHRKGVNIGHIQRQLGHSSPATTGVYLAGISNADVVDAVIGAIEMTEPLVGQSRSLTCPDCNTSVQGVESAVCSYGHKPVKLDWFPVCKCGHDSHYDMTTFCLADGCECQEWDPSENLRQVTRRSL